MSVTPAKQVLRKPGYIESPDWEQPDEGPHCHLDAADPAGCGWDVNPDAPLPICTKHLAAVYGFVRDSMGKAQQAFRQQGRSPSQPIPEYVYFIRRDGLIKIGWTTNMKSRMRALRPDEILHVEPGKQKDEAALHRAFRHLRIGAETGGPHLREWFEPGDDLLAFIDLRKRLASGVEPQE